MSACDVLDKIATTSWTYMTLYHKAQVIRGLGAF